MKTPSISVIMPVYNGERHLEEAIASITGQTFSDFELLVVNDCSTDRTDSIVRNCQRRDKRIRLLDNKLKKGLVGALNTGLEEARGRYIARADADDINRPYRFEEQVNFLERNPEIALLGGGYAPFNENGHRIDIYHPSGSAEIAWKFISNTYFCHPAVMLRREVYDQMGGYPDEAAEDYAYFSKIVRRHRGYNLKLILLDYREHQSNYSITNVSTVRESVRIISEENFRYYTGSTSNFGLFCRFQEQNQAPVRNLPRLFFVNLKIVNRIAKQYRLKLYDREIIDLHVKILGAYYTIILSALQRWAEARPSFTMRGLWIKGLTRLARLIK
jgi:glycosyltransferase involved in cell wall biosynthesis